MVVVFSEEFVEDFVEDGDDVLVVVTVEGEDTDAYVLSVIFDVCG